MQLCKPRKGSSLGSVSEEKREEAKAAAATRVQAKLEAKKGKGKKAK